MKSDRAIKMAAIVMALVPVLVGLSAFSGFVLWISWNTAGSAFHWSTLTFWQAWALSVLVTGAAATVRSVFARSHGR